MNLSGIAGRTAIVTGAAGGIGLAVTRLLIASGAHVIATDIDIAPLVGNAPEGLCARQLDVTRSDAVDALVNEVAETHDGIDFGVSVAGVLGFAPVAETNDQEWARIFAVNTSGVFHLGRALARIMKPQRSGTIVTVSSNAAGIPRQNMAAYAASKAAATMFTRCLGLELAPFGIRCNVIAPGSTRTPMQTSLWVGGNSEEKVIAGALDTYRTGIPLQKLATPEDIAHAVLFLLSEEAGHIALANLYVDGGATLTS
ncbi:2,3-dihydro-2,3-dihydroxybenzoate dehydrogenase [Afifella marina]|uniref:2,3-dihydro-2,3-dihydroxybenzoate dehydrogenase n=1 Tax=Afifella marina DSM 2698 TaxID=1120955 RepID=A0A1G5NVD1_AFIMA|nr:2,3-dihydro-2,3-dihydroxybenzoate dehydrogenase [Afifella marina]MBK1624141.1 2,3-dihydro-2,3-dihydroxybenzoate dehydrogenase [Afifella marina DSM 2698]MBK1627698.1 2,3-dihydro-2,3-dihydroxybenzoate dehydrogenase [Afifella marina]MBK5916422.1 2,3-dihydro-2,3-dihydroxybenzoate dehydrogenase [Afifella marina]RAI20976.1 2,3-dihydro-2,3-dihydroxybenzoate dehydrogenase [Afifella marina DSM 2698]SCZ40701.1 2,3-dihydro-2,3-dihydroxybenzoate dehydrogenase [Afifella marina DSM 2698]